MPDRHPLWAKLAKAGSGWHSLVDHSADVAAVMEALLAQPTIRRRLARLAGVADLHPVVCARLAALAFLHDIGKANRGFQARKDPKAPPIGHIDQLAWIFHGDSRYTPPFQDALIDRLGFERMAEWFTQKAAPMLDAVFAHHGRPWARDDPPFSKAYWLAAADGDPIAALAPLREKLDLWFPDAFANRPMFHDTPAFQHAFAGLLMLADWLGSDETFFPFANGTDPDRMASARIWARQAVADVGLVAEPRRAALHAAPVDFATSFGVAAPRPIQQAVVQPDANLLILEAETGSGKTEAALWRFKMLFEQGAVDGLYFALPTRVAATQMFARIKRFRDRVFPEGSRPGVVLAVPGHTRFDEAEVRRLPDFDVQWSDGDRRPERWAAESPKRFLAAPIAVGTVDQALLGAVTVKHAHLRGSLLLRHLLVVDEVHASSVYATALLRDLLRFHTMAGGHALLLSATLGGAARARLLGTPKSDADAAMAAPYPALSWQEGGRETRLPIEAATDSKTVMVTPMPLLAAPEAVAAEALRAAATGVCVLVIRNTVAAAMATARALEEQAGPDSPLLFRAEGVATVHHSRFAVEDRRRLDAAVEARLGKARPSGAGCVVAGSQTLEISLDLDADLLVTDIAPIDVLLQRIGRLHRHAGRARPDGFREPRLLLLVPESRDLLAARLTRYGLGLTRDGGIYIDLRMIEATWRLAEAHPSWTIPAMNRELVEAATHPDGLAAIEADLPGLAANSIAVEGRTLAESMMAGSAVLDRSQPFDTCIIPRDEHAGTRLGAGDRLVTFDPPRTGPFGHAVTALRLPAFLLRGIAAELEPADVTTQNGMLTFRLGETAFAYDRFGVVKQG